MSKVHNPMSARETSAQIDAAAALWAARVEARPLTADEDSELDRWLAGDARRSGAFAKARAVSLHLNRAKGLGVGFVSDVTPPRRAPSRRFFLAAGGVGALAAGVAAAVAGVEYFAVQRFQTRIGEVRVVSLEDGSVVTLNTASEIAIDFSAAQRAVTLVAGEVLFDVASDPRRPFVVRAGETLVRAIGTSFSVRRLADSPVRVMVREGVVEVSRADVRGGATQVVAQEMAIVTEASAPALTATPAAEIDRNLSWRDGRVSFEGETLRQAAAEFSRYSSVRMVFADPSIGDETVTGLYVSSDPIGFARNVGVAFDLDVTVGANEVVLSRPSAD